MNAITISLLTTELSSICNWFPLFELLGFIKTFLLLPPSVALSYTLSLLSATAVHTWGLRSRMEQGNNLVLTANRPLPLNVAQEPPVRIDWC